MKRLNGVLFMIVLAFSVVSLHGMRRAFSSYFQKYYPKFKESAQGAVETYGPQIKGYAQEQGTKLVEKAQNLRQYGSKLAEQYGPRIKSGAESAREAAINARRYVVERVPEVTQKVTEKYPQVRSWWGNLASRISSYWNPTARQSVSNVMRPMEEQSVKVATEFVQRPIEPGAEYLIGRQAYIRRELSNESQGRILHPQRVKNLQKEYDDKYLARELEKQRLEADIRQYE